MTSITVPEPDRTAPADGLDPSARLPEMFRRTLRESAYHLIGWPVALAGFVVIVTGLSLGAGLLVTIVGIPVLAGTLLAARGFAELERAQLRHLLERDVPPARYKRPGDVNGWFRKTLVPLTDGQLWLDVLHAFVAFVVSTATWVITVTWWATAVGGIVFPIWGWALPQDDPDSSDLPELLGLGDAYSTRVIFYVTFGLLVAASLPFVIRACTFLRAGLADLLLVSRSKTEQQVETLVAGRTAARSAEAGALRRLERDIHDGPQQRLVRLSMDLGRARKQAEGNPQLQGAIDDALRQTTDTLDELRALSRGIAPPVLADRGLRAALEELAARSSLPIAVDVQLPAERLPDHVETAVYFVVSEAMANIAKHSGATECALSVALVDGEVRVRVSDDGVGGAHLAKGHGLVGLSDRVRAADGILNVTSPDGGPTVIEAEVPCGS